MDNYNSYYSRVTENSKGRIFVTIINRYWPGGPTPDYLTLAALTPEQAMSLADDLKKNAIEADDRQNKTKLKSEIGSHVGKIAKEAKEEAYG